MILPFHDRIDVFHRVEEVNSESQKKLIPEARRSSKESKTREHTHRTGDIPRKNFTPERGRRAVPTDALAVRRRSLEIVIPSFFSKIFAFEKRILYKGYFLKNGSQS